MNNINKSIGITLDEILMSYASLNICCTLDEYIYYKIWSNLIDSLYIKQNDK